GPGARVAPLAPLRALRALRASLAVLLLALAACGPPASKPAEEVLKDLGSYGGKIVTIRARFRSGARCRQGDSGEWRTYCKDCQYCRGPIVLATSSTVAEGLDDWPLILGGTWDDKDIRCKGPLN